MCGVVRRRHHAGAVRLRGGPERRRRHLRLVRRRRPSRRATTRRRARAGSTCTSYLSELAAEQEVGAHGLVALDWHNGNRSVLVDHELSGLIVGLTLATRAEDIYRALVEATAFGTREDPRRLRRRGRAGARAVRRRRADQEPAGHAGLRRRDAPAAAPDRLRAGPGARLGDARRRRRRRPRGHPRRRGGDGQGRAATPTCPDDRARGRLRRALRALRARCTTTSGAAATTSCTALRRASRPRELARG